MGSKKQNRKRARIETQDSQEPLDAIVLNEQTSRTIRTPRAPTLMDIPYISPSDLLPTYNFSFPENSSMIQTSSTFLPNNRS